jgi:catechol 2,3-dioxygenase-like lactoylglutathione lyase family enzyme
MVQNGLDKVVISVSDIENAVRFFRDIIGLSLVHQGERDLTHYRDGWDIDIEGRGECAVLRKEGQAACIELLRFSPTSDQYVRDQADILDYGIYDIAFRTRDVDSVYAELSGKGFSFYSEPVVYTADWANVSVKEAILIGPDKIPFALIERLTEPVPQVDGDFGPIIDSAQVAEDMDEISRFYQEILGLTKIFDQWLPDGLVDDVLKLPPETSTRMAFFQKPGKDRPFFEFISFSRKGKSLAPWCRPPHIGILAQGCEAADLEGLLEKARDYSYEVIQEPTRVPDPIHGEIETSFVRGPNGVILELYRVS